MTEFFKSFLFEMFFSKEIKRDGNKTKLANIANSNVVDTKPPRAIVPP